MLMNQDATVSLVKPPYPMGGFYCLYAISNAFYLLFQYITYHFYIIFSAGIIISM